MPRKKRKIVSLEVLEPNSLWDYREFKVLNNFVCYQDEAEKTVVDMDRREFWKHETGYKDEVNAILAQRGTRNARDVFFGDDVNIEEVKLPSSVKPSTKYIYKVYDYTGEKLSTEYGVQKDAVAYIAKRIKSKYAIATYNGKSEKIENTAKTITDILNGLEDSTSLFEIEPIARSGVTDNTIMVSIFKNCLN